MNYATIQISDELTETASPDCRLLHTTTLRFISSIGSDAKLYPPVGDLRCGPHIDVFGPCRELSDSSFCNAEMVSEASKKRPVGRRNVARLDL